MIFITFYNQLHHDNMWMGPHKPRNITGGPCTQYEQNFNPIEGMSLDWTSPRKTTSKSKKHPFSMEFTVFYLELGGCMGCYKCIFLVIKQTWQWKIRHC